MTTAEAREKLIKQIVPEEQAAVVADVLEVWGQERAISKDYLDARLAELKADLRKELGELRADFEANLGDLRAAFAHSPSPFLKRRHGEGK